MKNKYNFKNSFFYIALIGLLLTFSISACDSWTEVEADFIDVPRENAEYYASLRAFKNSDHAKSWGWVAGWIGHGANMDNCLFGLPDSLDMVSIWGPWGNLSPEQMDDLHQTQKLKGTKVLFTILMGDLGGGCTPKEFKDSKAEYWGYNEGVYDDEAFESACRKYANAICDSIDKYDYDGFDIDLEPNYGSSGNIINGLKRGHNNPLPMTWFVTELSKRIGPKSGTKKMLVLDGECGLPPAELSLCFNYFITQAYNSYGSRDLDRRFASLKNQYQEYIDVETLAKMYIVTENFENGSYSKQGGNYPFTTREGETVYSLRGMALWNPILQGEDGKSKAIRKGGCGVYKITDSKYIREAIQVLNPAKK